MGNEEKFNAEGSKSPQKADELRNPEPLICPICGNSFEQALCGLNCFVAMRRRKQGTHHRPVIF
jgi:hypothetical protein